MYLGYNCNKNLQSFKSRKIIKSSIWYGIQFVERQHPENNNQLMSFYCSLKSLLMLKRKTILKHTKNSSFLFKDKKH